MTRAAIVGIAGPALDPDEATLFRRLPPAGVILFARNIQDPAQLRALTDSLRAVLPASAVIAVDQEGGRVARLRPPHWMAHPAAGRIGALHADDAAAGLRAAWLTGALIGAECAAAGIGLVCAPVLGPARARRARRGRGPLLRRGPARCGRAGPRRRERDAGRSVQPVAKHAPGHGRALVDSHLALPAVPRDQDLSDDIHPFAANADLPWMMTAHLLYPGLDADRPARCPPP